LNQFIGRQRIEVIVGAVPGYSSYEVLDWYDEFLYQLNPDLTIIYVGWNDMGQFHPWGLRYKNEGLYRERTPMGFMMQYSYLLRVPYFFLDRLERSKPVDLSVLTSDEEQMLSQFIPVHYEDNLTGLIEQSIEQGSEVYILSLASLLSYPATEDELKRMHFPRGINKKYEVYKGIYEKYALSLDKISNDLQVSIIDLNHIIATPEQREIFTDTVHITEQGAVRFADFIASELCSRVLELIAQKDRSEQLQDCVDL